jgi:DNA-binding transcriptional LysR family regulator
VEFGLFFAALENPQLEARVLAKVPFRLVAAPKWKSAEAALARFVASRELDYPKARRFPVIEMLEKNALSAHVALSSNNLQVQLEMVLAGFGAALLPHFMVDAAIAEKRLRVFHAKRRFVYDLKLVTRKAQVLSHNAERFIAALDALLATLAR